MNGNPAHLYRLLTNQQRRALVDTRQLYQAWKDATKVQSGYAGSMTWKQVRGADYLIRLLNRNGRQRSLGRRSEETEALYVNFINGKLSAAEHVKQTGARLEEQARLNKALQVGGIPTVAARILRELDQRGMLGRNVIVAGTHSIYAYEGLAGVRVNSELMETGDLDIMWDARTRLSLTAAPNALPGLIGALQAVDPSFAANSKRTYQAVSSNGYLVELIKAQPDPPWSKEPDAIAANDLIAAPIANLKWLANAPKVETVIAAEDGMPTPIAAVDPRAFALYKLWLGSNEPMRDPLKRQRDIDQAHVVAHIVREHLPQLPMQAEQLRMFPNEVVEAVGTPLWSRRTSVVQIPEPEIHSSHRTIAEGPARPLSPGLARLEARKAFLVVESWLKNEFEKIADLARKGQECLLVAQDANAPLRQRDEALVGATALGAQLKGALADIQDRNGPGMAQELEAVLEPYKPHDGPWLATFKERLAATPAPAREFLASLDRLKQEKVKPGQTHNMSSGPGPGLKP